MYSEPERLKAFRQLRQDIRGSERHLIVGIDIAKEKHYAFCGTATGKTLCKQMIFPNSKEGFELLTARVEAVPKLPVMGMQVYIGLMCVANVLTI